ncbi:MAG: ATP-binding protein P-loopNTPAse superfamily [Chitinophagaceae bacterium]|nr:MAG: ATP-binding protein P-loopNTPAse superfamily [Chitinophagaceae bacterium]
MEFNSIFAYICTMAKMINREIFLEAKFRLTQFRALCITGPRQSGKTTLCKLLFKDKPYLNFETPLVQAEFQRNPTAFFKKYAKGAIFDEVQRVPDVFRYLQEILDNNTKRGQFILTGSNNFLLQEQVSQSLAGRAGYLSLLPLSFAELKENKLNVSSVDDLILKGGYPEIWNEQLNISTWLESYIQTYVQRDVRLLKNINDLGAFTRFVFLCANAAGQLLNRDELAKNSRVDTKTIQSWLGLLESSYLVYLLQPWSNNSNTRLIKSPKLYFYDTGLLCFLKGIHSKTALQKHPQYGSIFENWIITEIKKNRYNQGILEPIYFYRNASGNEVDLVIRKNDELFGIEIKSGKKIDSAALKNLTYWQKQQSNSNGLFIYGGKESSEISSRQFTLPWNQIDHL